MAARKLQIKFCEDLRQSSAAALHAAQLIDDHARGLPRNDHQINNVRQELQFAIDMQKSAGLHLRAIQTGELTPAAAKELK